MRCFRAESEEDLSEAEVRLIRRYLDKGRVSQSVIAKRFRTTPGVVWQIARGGSDDRAGIIDGERVPSV
jgi:hypothetical protein